MNTIDQEL